MPRAKPFSGKAKKAQLQEKRAAKRADVTGVEERGRRGEAAGSERGALSLTTALAKSGATNRFTTVFAKERDDVIAERRVAAGDAVDLRWREAPDAWTAHVPTHSHPVLNHPRGLALSSVADGVGMVHHDLAAAEAAAFQAWLDAIYAVFPRTHLNHFEHNMEVWMQLWHTLASSHVICIVTDVRNPLWHLPMSLLRQVLFTLRKPLVIVLNKVDLVPPAHAAAWSAYLARAIAALQQEAGGPGTAATPVSIVPFSSSGEVLPLTASLSTRRKRIRESRRRYDPDIVARRVACVSALLTAVGMPPEDAMEVVARVQATARVSASCRGGHAGGDGDAAPPVEDDDGDEGSHDSEGSEGEDGRGRGRGIVDAADSPDGSGGSEWEEGVEEADMPKRGGRGGEQGAAMPTSTTVGRGRGGGDSDGSGVSSDEGGGLVLSDKAMRRRARKAARAAKAEGKAVVGGFTRGVLDGCKGVARAPSPAAIPAVGLGATPPKLIIGMVGHPNAGKSSVINTVCADKRVSVSRTAGHTKRAQNVPLTPRVHLLDSPGLVFPHALLPPPAELDALKAASAVGGAERGGARRDDDAYHALLKVKEEEIAMQMLLGVIPIAQVREPYTAVRFLMERMALERMYGLSLPKDEPAWTPLLLCEVLATKRGLHIARTGRPDAHAAGRQLLYDSQDGVLPVAWLPPAEKALEAPVTPLPTAMAEDGDATVPPASTAAVTSLGGVV